MFIAKDKFDKLREAMRNGDEKAAAILQSFRSDDGNCSSLMEEYFKPESEVETENVPEVSTPEVEVNGAPEMSRLEKYLADNEVKEGDDNYDEYVSEFYEMFPNEKPHEENSEVVPEEVEEKEDLITPLVDDEIEAIEEYQKFLNELLPSDMCPEKKAYITSKINKIIEDEKQHIEILKELQR